MRSPSLLLLLAASVLAQPDCARYKVAAFSGPDSVNIFGVVGDFADGDLGFMRLNADGTDCEFAVPTGTDLPVNQRAPALLGHATADTMTINVANITVLNTDSTVNNISQTTDTATINDRLRLDYATANRPLQTDASKNVVTGSYTGTGTTEVLSAGPTISNLTGTGMATFHGLRTNFSNTDSAPYFSRTLGTNVAATALTLHAQNPGTAGDGYGTAMWFRVSDNIGANRPQGLIAFGRDGTINSGRFALTVFNGGAQLERYSITAAGLHTLTGTVSVTGAATFQSNLAVTGLMSPTRINIGGTDPSSLYANPTTLALVPYFQRQSPGDGSAGVRATLRLSAATDATISDGFGSDILLQIREGSNNPNTLASFGVGRETNNTSGKFRVNVYNNGSPVERYTISRLGEHVFTGNTTASGASNATRFVAGTGTSILDTLQANVLDIGTITGGGLFDSMEVDGPFYLPDLTANRPLYLDGDNKIATGTWSGTGTQVPTTQGATMNNLTATGTFTTPTAITMGSNTFARSGAHNLTLTTGANTNVTLPASGTLATLAGTETLSGKTLTAPTLTGTTTAGRITGSDSISAALGVRTPYLDVSGPTPSHGIRVFTRALTTGAVHNSAVRVDNSFSGGLGRDVVSALHLTITENDGSADTTAAVYIGAVDPGIVDGWAVMSPTTAPSYFGGDVTVWGDIDLGDGILYVGSGIEAIKYLGSGSSIEIGANVADGGSIYIGNSSAGNAGRVEIIATGGVNSQNGPYHIGGASGVTGTCSSVTVVGGIVTGCTP